MLYPDAEDAHHVGTKILKELWSLGLYPRERTSADTDGLLSTRVFGHELSNPMGISGGLDKNGEIPDPLFALGAGVVEIGGITPLPQPGNPLPRVFRVQSQNAIINRYGLNSEGADVVAMRLRQRLREFAYAQGLGLDQTAEEVVLNGSAGVPPGSLHEGRLLAVQIAKNKDTPDADLDAVVRDHVVCVEKLGRYADIIVVNVSSPNTPGLRALQSHEPLTRILSSVVQAAQRVDRKSKPAVMVKISPDEDSDQQVQGVCDAVWETGVSGVIVGNTTKGRPQPLPQGYKLSSDESQTMLEAGGYSGPQLFPNTIALIKKYRKTLDEGSAPDEAPQPTSGKTNPKPVMQKTDAVGPIRDHSDTRSLEEKIEASVARDAKNLKSPSHPTASEEKYMPTIKFPERHGGAPADTGAVVNPAASRAQKVIFASGGITNGEQALAALDAGASVAMIYTAMTYGGVGTIARIKQEIKDEVRSKVGSATLLAR